MKGGSQCFASQPNYTDRPHTMYADEPKTGEAATVLLSPCVQLPVVHAVSTGGGCGVR